MRHALHLALPRQGALVRRLADSSETRGFPSERLRAFATRFAPSNETPVQTALGLVTTAAIYFGIGVLAIELITANLAPLLALFR
jgi:hypothetical protein